MKGRELGYEWHRDEERMSPNGRRREGMGDEKVMTGTACGKEVRIGRRKWRWAPEMCCNGDPCSVWEEIGEEKGWQRRDKRRWEQDS